MAGIRVLRHFVRFLTLDNQGVGPELVFRFPSRGDGAVVVGQGKLAAACAVELGAVLAGHGEGVSQALVKVKTERMANSAQHLAQGRATGTRVVAIVAENANSRVWDVSPWVQSFGTSTPEHPLRVTTLSRCPLSFFFKNKQTLEVFFSKQEKRARTLYGQGRGFGFFENTLTTNK